jgi:hypothetical protein
LPRQCRRRNFRVLLERLQLEIDFDDHGVVGAQHAPLRLLHLLARFLVEHQSGRLDRALLRLAVRALLRFLGATGNSELLLDGLALFGRQALQDTELLRGGGLGERSCDERARDPAQKPSIEHQNPCCQLRKPCTREEESEPMDGSS